MWRSDIVPAAASRRRVPSQAVTHVNVWKRMRRCVHLVQCLAKVDEVIEEISQVVVGLDRRSRAQLGRAPRGRPQVVHLHLQAGLHLADAGAEPFRLIQLRPEVLRPESTGVAHLSDEQVTTQAPDAEAAQLTVQQLTVAREHPTPLERGVDDRLVVGEPVPQRRRPVGGRSGRILVACGPCGDERLTPRTREGGRITH